MAQEIINQDLCWCIEVCNYTCSDCLSMDLWKKLPPEKKIFAIRWLKAEKKFDAKKSMDIHLERDKRFPGWDFSPEDIPIKIWEMY